MDTFRTLLPSPQLPLRITYQHPVLSMGSCFAEQIGNRLSRLKFPHLLNPFGIVYHPLVLAAQLDELSGRDQWVDLNDIFKKQGLWRHYAFHSRFAQAARSDLPLRLRAQIRRGSTFLQQTKVLILTLGTAYGYRLKDNGNWVNNCHKQPASTFVRKRATVEEIVNALGNSLSSLQRGQPDLQVLLTVSPVRHLRDGLIDNQRSKAILLLACEELSQVYEFVHYFPAYEYLLDDLRDYRFYGPDMLHPSPAAVDYIWEHFTNACWDSATRALATRIEKLVQAAEHRPLHRDSESFRAFQQQQQATIRMFQKDYPQLDFSRELTLLEGVRGSI